MTHVSKRKNTIFHFNKKEREREKEDEMLGEIVSTSILNECSVTMYCYILS